MIGIVVSRADAASEHVGDNLLELADWTAGTDGVRSDAEGGGTVYRTDGFELRTFDDLHISLDVPAAAFDDPSMLVFVSRHAGETGRLLTAHATGNFGAADYGGAPGELARACPNAERAVVSALREYAPPEYDVGVECTHHGPSAVGVPSMFVELGSDEAAWEDPAGARAVARAVLDLDGVVPDRREGDRTRHLVGFGGGHYAPRFERILRDTDWAVGHVAADWALESMGAPERNRGVVDRAFAASAATHALVEGERPDLRAVIDDLGYRVVSETWVRETDGVALDLVERVESALAPVESGLRFGDVAPESPEDVTVVSLPAELLEAALGVDVAATRAAVAGHTVGFETSEGGTRPTGRAVVDDDGATDRLVDSLAAVLERSYDAVERRADSVLVRTTRFDPDKARERGVPEGPAFGRLADGETVEVGGERVEPETVTTERVREFPV